MRNLHAYSIDKSVFVSANRRKFGGKEYMTEFGLDELDYGARRLDPRLGHFTTPDPLATSSPSISPWSYCNGDPINFIDPTGKYTEATDLGNGRYQITGGSISSMQDLLDLLIYIVDADNIRTGEILGITPTPTSFYNSDKDSEESKHGWQIGLIIDMNDTSGIDFLNNIKNNPPPLFTDYIPNARNNHKYDFKATNGNGNGRDPSLKHYRGMPIGYNFGNVPIIASARDIGNMTAGYMAAINGIPLGYTMTAFTVYQSISSNSITFEGISTDNAELYGWKMGNLTTTNIRKNWNLKSSVAHGVIDLVIESISKLWK